MFSRSFALVAGLAVAVVLVFLVAQPHHTTGPLAASGAVGLTAHSSAASPTPAPPPTSPAATSSPGIVLISDDEFWQAVRTSQSGGYLLGSRCTRKSFPQGAARGNPTPTPPQCQVLSAQTEDEGSTWTTEALGQPEPGDVYLLSVGLSPDGQIWAIEDHSVVGQCTATRLIVKNGETGEWRTLYESSLALERATLFSNSTALLAGSNCSLKAGTRGPEADFGPLHLLVSHDGGATWQERPLPPGATDIQWSASNPSLWWFSDGVSVTLTDDAGTHWRRIGLPWDSQGQLSAYFLDADTGWLFRGSQPGAGSQAKAIYGTKDGGTTWQPLAGVTKLGAAPVGGIGSLGYVGPMRFLDEDNGWTLLGRGPLMATRDGGHTWLPMIENGADGLQFPSFLDTDHIWVFDHAAQALWSTDDGGATWTQISAPH